MSGQLSFIKEYETYCPQIKAYNDRNECMQIHVRFPIVMTDLSGSKKRIRYARVEKTEDGTQVAQARSEDRYGNQFEIVDVWSESKQGICIQRTVKAVKVEKETGIRLTTELCCLGERETYYGDYQFLIPGAYYNDNDTDQDGIEDYLGTHCIDLKDDRNAMLSVTTYAKYTGMYVSLIRADVPKKDTTITREQIRARHFIHDTDIGSLGISPSEYHTGEVILRCDYPFYERNSVCLNVDGSEWAAYKEVKEGTEFSVSYLLLMGEAEDLTEASWKSSKVQMERILKPEVELPFTLKEAQKYRTQLVHNSYKRFEEKKGNPSGYFLHFSPRKRFGDHHLLEYGFTGAQTLLAYDMLVAACRDEFDVPLTGARENAIHALDYFVDNCIEDTGLPNGIYNVDTEQVVYWWTGILFPFQYSRDREMLEEYLGNQIVSSLMAVAETLGKVKGNYCRSMTDTMLYLMKSYLHEKERGCEHTKWLEAVKRYCDKLVEIQNENGSWNRGYSMDGVPLTEPAEWFGRNEIERGSGAIFPIPLLIDLYHLTGNYAYYESARKAASFILKTYVANVYYIGGINDTSHKKSVKMDAASVMFVMRSLLVMYEETKEQEFLEGAVKAAKILVTWTYIWDVPYDENTLLGEHGFKTTGWAVCDAIPAGSYKLDGIAMLPLQLPAVDCFIKRMKERNMPLVFFNLNSQEEEGLAYVGCDYYEAGRVAAGLIALSIGNKGKIVIATSYHKETLSFSERLNGFIDELDREYPEIEIVNRDEDYIFQEDDYSNILKVLSGNPDVKALYLVNPGDYGLCKAVAGFFKDHRVKIITNDLVEEKMELLMDGTISAAIGQEPLKQGTLPLQILYD